MLVFQPLPLLNSSVWSLGVPSNTQVCLIPCCLAIPHSAVACAQHYTLPRVAVFIACCPSPKVHSLAPTSHTHGWLFFWSITSVSSTQCLPGSRRLCCLSRLVYLVCTSSFWFALFRGMGVSWRAILCALILCFCGCLCGAWLLSLFFRHTFKIQIIR